jgi:beta-lactamase regulating signal transducer with metallopeptidase domain/tetratricopeptide (TPR) repeat protein
MAFWQAFTHHPEMQTLGWILINFLWQGTLLALALKAVLTAMRRQRAALRYWTAAATLLLLIVVPVLTFLMPREAPAPIRSQASQAGIGPAINLYPTPPEANVDGATATFIPPAATSPNHSDSAIWSPDRMRELPARLPEALLSWIAAFWILGFVVMGIRVLGGVIQANRLKKGARAFNDGDDIRLPDVEAGTAGRVRLLESARIAVPTVIGWLRPAVIFPAGVAMQSSHLQALLAHELEHVRRRDYLVNLLQTAVEALLFFHPAVWWVAARMRLERECCCDDAAVKSCGDLRVYLRALSEAEHRRSDTRLALALSGTSLLHRIGRLTEMRSIKSSRLKTWSAVISAFTVLLLFSTAAIHLAFVPVQAEPAIVLDREEIQTRVTDNMTLSSLEGYNFSPQEVAELEHTVAENPDNLEAWSLLLSYYYTHMFKDGTVRQKHEQSVLWLIQNHPEAKVLGDAHGKLFPWVHNYAEGERLWKSQLQNYRDNLKIIANACSYLQGGNIDLAIECYEYGKSLDPENAAEWYRKLATAYNLKMANSPAEEKALWARDMLSALENTYEESKPTTFSYNFGDVTRTVEMPNISKVLLLPRIAKAALAAGELGKAVTYAHQLLEAAEENPAFRGDNLYEGNLVLGLLAVREGNLDAAEIYLLQAAEAFGFAGMHRVSPDMSLAKDLLSYGRRDTVLEFLRKGEKVVNTDLLPFSQWIQEMEEGRSPDFDQFRRELEQRLESDLQRLESEQ